MTILSLSRAHTCTKSALAVHSIPVSACPAKTVRMNPGGHATSYLDTIIGNTNKGDTRNEGNTNAGNTSSEGNTNKLSYLYYIVILLIYY